MAEDPEVPRKTTPPPPDIKKGPPPAPVPSAFDRPSADPPPAPLKVSVSDRDADEDADGGADGAPGGDPGLQDRVVATVIDLVLCMGLVVAVKIALPDLLHSLGQLGSIAYLLTRDSLPFLGGQSVGKKAMRIQAVTMDGRSLAGNWQPGLIRNAVLLIPFFAFVELYVLITRQDTPGPARRLGDEWAGTKVIRAAEPVVAEPEPSDSVPPDSSES